MVHPMAKVAPIANSAQNALDQTSDEVSSSRASVAPRPPSAKRPTRLTVGNASAYRPNSSGPSSLAIIGSSKSWIATLMMFTAPDAIAPMATFRPLAVASGFLFRSKSLASVLAQDQPSRLEVLGRASIGSRICFAERAPNSFAS